ncbi:MAG TPA: hypothetical protein DIU07_07445 [Rhodobacteraceae bacterium]|nr:hypothetical protein [Paracoccaceae bacterium]
MTERNVMSSPSLAFCLDGSIGGAVTTRTWWAVSSRTRPAAKIETAQTCWARSYAEAIATVR